MRPSISECVAVNATPWNVFLSQKCSIALLLRALAAAARLVLIYFSILNPETLMSTFTTFDKSLIYFFKNLSVRACGCQNMFLGKRITACGYQHNSVRKRISACGFQNISVRNRISACGSSKHVQSRPSSLQQLLRRPASTLAQIG